MAGAPENRKNRDSVFGNLGMNAKMIRHGRQGVLENLPGPNNINAAQNAGTSLGVVNHEGNRSSPFFHRMQNATPQRLPSVLRTIRRRADSVNFGCSKPVLPDSTQEQTNETDYKYSTSDGQKFCLKRPLREVIDHPGTQEALRSAFTARTRGVFLVPPKLTRINASNEERTKSNGNTSSPVHPSEEAIGSTVVSEALRPVFTARTETLFPVPDMAPINSVEKGRMKPMNGGHMFDINHPFEDPPTLMGFAEVREGLRSVIKKTRSVFPIPHLSPIDVEIGQHIEPKVDEQLFSLRYPLKVPGQRIHQVSRAVATEKTNKIFPLPSFASIRREPVKEINEPMVQLKDEKPFIVREVPMQSSLLGLKSQNREETGQVVDVLKIHSSTIGSQETVENGIYTSAIKLPDITKFRQITTAQNVSTQTDPLDGFGAVADFMRNKVSDLSVTAGGEEYIADYCSVVFTPKNRPSEQIEVKVEKQYLQCPNIPLLRKLNQSIQDFDDRNGITPKHLPAFLKLKCPFKINENGLMTVQPIANADDNDENTAVKNKKQQFKEGGTSSENKAFVRIKLVDTADIKNTNVEEREKYKDSSARRYALKNSKKKSKTSQKGKKRSPISKNKKNVIKKKFQNKIHEGLTTL